MEGQAVLGISSTDSWNGISIQPGGNSATITDAVNASGTATDVDVSLSNFFIIEDSSTAPQPTGDGPLDGPSSGPLAQNLFVAYSIGVPGLDNNEPSTIDYSNLSANTLYYVVLYGRNQPGADGREFTVTTNGLLDLPVSETQVDDESPTFTSTLNPTETATFGSPAYDGNYVELMAETDASGNLDLSLTSTGGEFDVSGVQIEAVPEPGAFSMMALGAGALALLAYRRRQMFTSSL